MKLRQTIIDTVVKVLGAVAVSLVATVVLDYATFKQYSQGSMKQVVYDTFSKDANVLRIGKSKINFEPYRLGDRVVQDLFGSNPHVCVKVHWAALNPVDVKMMHGNFKLLNHEKRVGFEFAGTIERMYHSVYGSRFQEGDRVCGMLPIDQVGALSEYLNVPETWIAKVPPTMSLKEAATIPMALMTAHMMVETALYWDFQSTFAPPLKVLVLGGNTSVGRMAIQLIRLWDPSCPIYATVGRDTCLMADMKVVPLNYKDRDWWTQMDNIDAELKFSLIVDCVGGKHNWEHGKKRVHKYGEYVTCVGDDQKPFTIGEIFRRGAQILVRNTEAGYRQVACQGADAEPLIQYLSKVQGNPGDEFEYTDEGVEFAMKSVLEPLKPGKPVVHVHS